ncbi:hypothetical protein NUSPORA_01304 [Nucleospora cyclopteri]
MVFLLKLNISTIMWLFRFSFCFQVAIIDAGSTGTRLHIYTFDGDKVLKSETFYNNGPIERNQHSEAEGIIKDLLNRGQVTKLIPIAFYGTAGLRSYNKTADLIKVIRNVLYLYNLIEIKVLKGFEEGLGLFEAFQYFLDSDQKYTLFDMGGKSTQVVQKNYNEVTISSVDTGIASKRQFYRPSIASKPDLIYLFSGFADVLTNIKYGKISDIDRMKKKSCKMQKSYLCNDLNFLMEFFDQMRLKHDQQFKVIDEIKGFYISWPLGKAIKIAKNIKNTKYLYNKKLFIR